MKTPIDILDEELIKLREKLQEEHNDLSHHETQMHECKIGIVEIEHQIKIFEMTIIELKGKSNG